MTTSTAPLTWVKGCSLDDKVRKARYGVRYIQSIAAQAGWTTLETEPDADVKAIDLRLEHEIASVGVQVKCSHKPPTNSGHFSVSLRETWAALWSRQGAPVYLVYVHVPTLHQEWTTISPSSGTTVHRVVAYWVRVDTPSLAGLKTLEVPVTSVFTPDTLEQWYDHERAGVTGGVTP
ncbi:DUF4365 domain-containing protein [Serinicoccus sp. LYQ131]|uniref:DUF4365 domain-containing protein n=1 Tax=Serinicoccus sp. LYQ131 TaxID=3378797 RepID=UPI00385243E0